jgi:hypothetical protein
VNRESRYDPICGNILVLHVDHTLRMCIAKVTRMWQPEMYVLFSQRIFDFIGVYASGETGDEFGDFCFITCVEDIGVDQKVFAKHG